MFYVDLNCNEALAQTSLFWVSHLLDVLYRQQASELDWHCRFTDVVLV
jgi:hypothetical protein